MPRLIAAILLLAGTVAFSACDSGVTGPGTDTFDRAGLLTNLAENQIVPAYGVFAQSTAALDAAVTAFLDAPNATTLAEAQQALKAARLAWQDVNLFQFGPAEQRALRSSLNTFPLDVERVEANIAAGDWTLGTLANQAAQGFPALDYLLHAGTDAEIIAAYATAADADKRAAYLRENAAFVDANAQAVYQAWRADGGNYVGEFLSPAMGGVDVGSALGQTVNALVRHYERFLRDGKIGIPAGIRSAGVPRPQAVEARFDGYSAELARVNVQAVQRLYLGGAGLGFDDYLRTLDAADVDADIKAAFAATQSALLALNDPLSTQIETDNDAVLRAFAAMQDLVVLLKADMTSTLGVTITFMDNDGD